MKELNMTIKCVCPFCGKVQLVKINSADYEKWENGELIQRAFPYLTPGQREAIMTGICDDCFPS